MAIDNIDPNELSLQDAAGMQLVHVIRRIIEEINNGGDTPTPTPSEPTGIYYCTFDVTTKDEITAAIDDGLLPVCYHAAKMHYLVAYQWGVYTFATISRDRGIISRIDCRVNGWAVQEPLEIQKLLTFDYAPTQNSVNPVTSGGVWTAMQNAGGGTPSDAAPNMDGVASAGISDAYSRGDHRHPSDTSRLEKNQGSSNANKFMVVDSNGDVVPSSVPDATIENAVDDWLAQNIAQETGYVLDSSLTMSNAAAPADKVGALKNELATKTALTEEIKQALLNCFENVAWINDQGQTYYDALENALYQEGVLTSISATFDQTGLTVYFDTDLEVLKNNLTVTAHYSSGTTNEVTSYTLSGNLTEGTSVITVSYGGKTTTFNVTVSSYLPNGYTRVNALTSTGTQYIDTGINFTNQMKYEIDVSGLQNNTTNLAFAFGAFGNNVDYSAGLQMYGTNFTPSANRGKAFFRGNPQTQAAISSNGLYFTVDQSSKYKCSQKDNIAWVDGVQLENTFTSATWTLENTFVLFARKDSSNVGRFMPCTIYRAKFYGANDILIHDFIPCLDDNNIPCMYDIVGNQKYSNLGTGTFDYEEVA